MNNLSIGYLFRKKNVIYQSIEFEIFELVDYVAGIVFINNQNNKRCNILSGNYAGNYSTDIKNSNENEFIFVSDSLKAAIEENENFVDFDMIRKNKIQKYTKYYLRDVKNAKLTQLVDKDLIDFLENDNSKGKSGFDEEELENCSDIATMYSSIKKTIISQDEQIMQILTTLFKNQKVVESNLDIDLIAKLKENILIYGSTGTGKTEILKRISKDMPEMPVPHSNLLK